MALRCLQGLTDGNDDQESDYFGQALVEFAGLLTPDAPGDPNVKLIRADDATLIHGVRGPTWRWHTPTPDARYYPPAYGDGG